MQEGVIVKVPIGSEPLAIRQQWLYLRFVFDEIDDYSVPSCDPFTGESMPLVGREFAVRDDEAYRIMDSHRPELAAYYRANSMRQFDGWDFTFREDEIHFLEGTEVAWG